MCVNHVDSGFSCVTEMDHNFLLSFQIFPSESVSLSECDCVCVLTFVRAWNRYYAKISDLKRHGFPNKFFSNLWVKEWEGLWLTNGKASWDNHLHKPHLSLPLSGWSRFSQNHRAKVSAQHFRIRTSPRFLKVHVNEKHIPFWNGKNLQDVTQCTKNVHWHMYKINKHVDGLKIYTRQTDGCELQASDWFMFDDVEKTTMYWHILLPKAPFCNVYSMYLTATINTINYFFV